MLTRMLMTTVAAFVLAAPVAAQDQAKPAQAQQEMQQQEQQPAPGAAADQAPTAAQDQPAEAAPGAADQPPAMTAEGAPAAPETPTMTESAPVEEDVAEEPEAMPPPDMAFLEEQQAAQFLAADEVIGQDVVNAGDEEVGEIADLVMDQDQKLVGVVLSVGGFLGIGEKWVAVPVDSIQFPTDEQPARLLVAVTKEQLENAPDFVTRDTVEAQEAAEQAQMQQQQTQPLPPATATQ